MARTANTPNSMVINTTSSAHNAAKALGVDQQSDLRSIGGLTGAYATTKLALTTMGTAKAGDLDREGITFRSVCPGAVITPMTKTSDAMPGFLKFFVPIFFNKPEKQAAKRIKIADPGAFSGRTGTYFANGKAKALPKLALDPALQRRLMEKLAGDAAAA